MAQDILPQGSEPERTASNPSNPQVLLHEADPKQQGKPRQIRLPVGVALGLVFSLLLVIICGSIIAYVASSDRRIALRLLNEQSRAVLKSNETVLHGFFKRQEQLFQSFAGHASLTGRDLSDKDLASYSRVLPQDVKLELRRAAPGRDTEDVLPSPTWSQFRFKEGYSTAVTGLEINLGNGQLLIGYFPQTVFARLVRDMAWDDGQQNFLLKDRNTAIAINGVPEGRFAASRSKPLPDLAGLTGSPLHLLWQDPEGEHTMGGDVQGRLFPAGGRMYTAIYTEFSDGPAQGWIVGTLYRAADFGAVLDQTWAVLYAALAALVVGAILSFLVGRTLGRPLSRLATSAAELRKLNFEAAERLPRSRLAELDDVNQAFNGSVGALNAFAKYVPRQLVSRLIEEGMTSSRNIELREMTIVFTDLAGFTGKASHLTAEQTASYLNTYFETVSEAIAENEGTIDKFLGDGVMAFWGAPSDQPDHAALAVAAVKSLAERLEQSGKRDMRVRIGVHTGKVVVGDIGTPSRMNYTVIGDAVNVAARLQEYGKHIDPDATVIALASARTIGQMPDGFSGTSLGQVQLRGRDEPLGVFRIA